MDPQELRDTILLATLPHVAFDGWTWRALQAGAADAGLGSDDALRAFPRGMTQAVDHFADLADRQMMTALEALPLDTMRVSERVSSAIRLRLQANAAHREAVRRAASFLSMPQNAALAGRITLRTVNAVWYAVGDTSTDFNFYSKRALLLPVYTATVLFWLADESEDFAETWDFLDRRLADVLKLPGLKSKVTQVFARVLPSSRMPRRPRRAAS